MFLTIASWAALAVMLLGLAYKIKVWLSIGIGPEARGLTPFTAQRARFMPERAKSPSREARVTTPSP